MSSKVWLLVELFLNDSLPSYKVIVVKKMEYDPYEMQPGNEIMVKPTKNERAKPIKAKIIRVSEKKRYIDDQVDLLKHQNEKFKTIVKLCMQKSRPTIDPPQAERREVNQQRSRKRFRPVHKANQRDTSSDTEPPIRKRRYYSRKLKPVKTTARTISIDDSGSGTEVGKNEHHSRNRKIKPNAVRLNRADSSSDCEQELELYNGKSNKALPSYAMEFGKWKNDRRAPWVSSTPVINDQKIDHRHQESQTEEDLISQLNDINYAIENMSKVYGSLLRVCELVNINVEEVLKGNDLDSSDNEISSDFDHYEYDYKTEPSILSLSRHEESSDCDEIRSVRNVGEAVEDSGSDSDRPLNELRNRMGTPRSPKVRRISEADNDNAHHAPSPSNDKDMSPIGSGYAKVPTRLLQKMDWSSPTAATSHLLQAIFPRSVLATHCLSGQQSPPFMKRPPKKVLDPKLVEDIVKIVSTQCEIPELMVRNNITIKCAEEAKLYRNRQKMKALQRKGDLINDENRSPVAASVNCL